MIGEADLGSSVAGGPPEVDGSTGIDMRWVSLCAPETGDSGLLEIGTWEFRLCDSIEAGSALAQLGVLSILPACDPGDATVGKACIDLAKVVISANSIDVRSHMNVFIVVVLS